MLFLSLHWLGLIVYGGSLFAFAILLAWAARQPLPTASQVVATYRLWGPGLGIAMGALIFGGLARYYQVNGAFTWPIDTSAQQLTATKHGLFLGLWFSSFHLEIWTLEAVRKLTGPDGEIADEAAWRTALRRVIRQAGFNVCLFVVLGILSIAARLA